MLAIVAVVCFVLASFKVAPGGFDLVPVGLTFVALHLALAGPILPAWPSRTA